MMARPKRKKNTRTDAALDAMRQYGFADNLTRKHLKQLLKVYGEDYWFFIEENAYKVLLESILEQAEKDAITQLAYQEAGKGDIGAGSSRDVLAGPHSDIKTSDIALQTREVLKSAASQHNGGSKTALLTCKPGGGNGHLSPKGEGTSNQIKLDQNYIAKHTTTVIKTSGIDHIGNTNFPPLHATHTPQATDGVKIRRRRPYHGWIDDDEEEGGEVDLVELQPMPLSPELARLLSQARSLGKS